MQILFVVLNREKDFEGLLEAFAKAGVRGGTILETEGLASSIASQTSEYGYGRLHLLLNDGRPFNRTIFLLLPDEKVESVKGIVRQVIGDIGAENTGILFTLPVSSVEGLTK